MWSRRQRERKWKEKQEGENDVNIVLIYEILKKEIFEANSYLAYTSPPRQQFSGFSTLACTCVHTQVCITGAKRTFNYAYAIKACSDIQV